MDFWAFGLLQCALTVNVNSYPLDVFVLLTPIRLAYRLFSSPEITCTAMSYSNPGYHNAYPSAIAGPSTLNRPPTLRRDLLHCKNCPPANRSALELTVDNLFACLICGHVDESATQSHNTVSVSDTCGALLDPDEHRRTFAGDWDHFSTRAEKSFQVRPPIFASS